VGCSKKKKKKKTAATPTPHDDAIAERATPFDAVTILPIIIDYDIAATRHAAADDYFDADVMMPIIWFHWRLRRCHDIDATMPLMPRHRAARRRCAEPLLPPPFITPVAYWCWHAIARKGLGLVSHCFADSVAISRQAAAWAPLLPAAFSAMRYAAFTIVAAGYYCH